MTREMLALCGREHEDILMFDSTNFIDYALKGIPSSVRNWQFAPNLDLGEFTPVIQDVYGQMRDVYVFPEQREKEPMVPRVTGYKYTDSLTKTLAEDVDAFWQQKAKAECSTTVYYDPKLDAVDYSEVRSYKFAEAETETYKLAEEEKIPMIEIHTHDTDCLLTPQDYSRLLLGVFNDGSRLVSSLIVLCPSMQVLALPTPATPSLNFEETVEFVKGCDQRIKHFDKRKAIAIVDRIQGYIDQLSKTEYEDYLALIYETSCIEVKGREGEVSDEQFMTYSKGEEAKFERKLQAEYVKSKRAIGRMLKRFWGKENMTLNTDLLMLSRALGVKLYFSTDMKNFKEFTA